MLSWTKLLRSYGVLGPRRAVMPRTRYETGPRRTWLDIGANSSVGSVPFGSNGTKENVMPFMPAVPDVDLATFALRHAVRLADRPAVIDDRVLTYGELAERTGRASTERDVVAI